MPKETILKSNVPVNGRTERMHVSWGKDLDTVQLGVEFPDGGFRFESNETGSPADKVYCSLWTELNRTDLNKLIRILRRARNQSFGEDE